MQRAVRVRVIVTKDVHESIHAGVHLCVHLHTQAEYGQRLAGDQGAAKKGKPISPEVYLFDVGRSLLSVSAQSEPQHSHTSA